MAASYDLMTRIGKCRFRIPDTDVSKSIFEDDELQVLLDEHEDRSEKAAVLLAAADALEIIAGDPQRLRQWGRGSVSVGRTATVDIWKKVDRYRGQAAGGITVGRIERSDFW